MPSISGSTHCCRCRCHYVFHVSVIVINATRHWGCQSVLTLAKRSCGRILHSGTQDTRANKTSTRQSEPLGGLLFQQQTGLPSARANTICIIIMPQQFRRTQQPELKHKSSGSCTTTHKVHRLLPHSYLNVLQCQEVRTQSMGDVLWVITQASDERDLKSAMSSRSRTVGTHS